MFHIYFRRFFYRCSEKTDQQLSNKPKWSAILSNMLSLRTLFLLFTSYVSNSWETQIMSLSAIVVIVVVLGDVTSVPPVVTEWRVYSHCESSEKSTFASCKLFTKKRIWCVFFKSEEDFILLELYCCLYTSQQGTLWLAGKDKPPDPPLPERQWLFWPAHYPSVTPPL